MARWEVTITKQIGAETWTNVYWVEAETLDAAGNVAAGIVGRERAMHYQQVEFVSYRVSDGVPGTDIFRIVPIGQNGAVAPTGQLLPLFNTLRVDFGAAAGRPSRKYLRGCLAEDDIDFIFVQAAAKTRAQTYGTLMIEDNAFVDVDGQDLITAVVYQQVQMRQLRRGSKRRPPTP
jgi:hypothetical protein